MITLKKALYTNGCEIMTKDKDKFLKYHPFFCGIIRTPNPLLPGSVHRINNVGEVPKGDPTKILAEYYVNGEKVGYEIEEAASWKH